MNRLLECLPDVYVHPDIDLTTVGPYGSQGIARTSIQAGTCIARINFDDIITPEKACAAFGLNFDEICRQDLESSVLAAYLITHKSPYVEHLPKQFNTPIYWTEEDLAWLQGTNLSNEPAIRLQRMALQLKQFQALRPLPITSEQWVWAHSVINSRSFPSSLIDPERESHPILLPVLDTFNHKTAQAITWSPDFLGRTLSFVTGSRYAQGEEVFNNYGGKSNEEFLMSYGFTVDALPSDHVAVKLPGGERHLITRALTPTSLLDEFRRHGGDEVTALSMFCNALDYKMEKIGDLGTPMNERQRMAEVYRRGQLEICALAIERAEEEMEALESEMER